MIYMHSKYDNMHKNWMFYVVIFINNHVIACYDCMSSQFHFSLAYKAHWDSLSLD